MYFVPALAGLGAPYWDPEARGAFLGLTRGTTKAQMIRAALEGIAFQVDDLLHSMNQDCETPLKVLRVDGGAAANQILLQTQANLSRINVDRPKNLETTAFGAALFAGLGVGLFSSLDELKSARQQDALFAPEQNSENERESFLNGWKKAVKAVQAFK